MKKCLYSLLILFCIVTSCHRRTVAARGNTRDNNGEVKPLLSANEASGGAVFTPVAPVAPVTIKPVIIVDARGNFAVTDSTLPAGASKDILDPSNARAYTPAQTKTLAYRFGKVPPRILYVSNSLAKKSAKGTYYVLDKKFWYWKKSNGYFYIDENYFR